MSLFFTLRLNWKKIRLFLRIFFFFSQKKTSPFSLMDYSYITLILSKAFCIWMFAGFFLYCIWFHNVNTFIRLTLWTLFTLHSLCVLLLSVFVCVLWQHLCKHLNSNDFSQWWTLFELFTNCAVLSVFTFFLR